MNLPTAELQVEIFSRLGTHRVDFAWPQFKIALEFDGWGKYFDYAPTAQVVALERKREKVLAELGWQIVRVFWEDLEHPAVLERRIQEAFFKAGAPLRQRRSSNFSLVFP